MAKYAEGTSVPAEKSRAEIEQALVRWGADSFLYGRQDTQAVVMFAYRGRQIRFTLPLPSRYERRFTHTPARDIPRTDAEIDKLYDQAVRQRWRALLLVVKAKLESVESGIETFEQAFLAHTVLPSGETVADWLDPQIDQAIEARQMPAMIPGPRPALER